MWLEQLAPLPHWSETGSVAAPVARRQRVAGTLSAEENLQVARLLRAGGSLVNTRGCWWADVAEGRVSVEDWSFVRHVCTGPMDAA